MLADDTVKELRIHHSMLGKIVCHKGTETEEEVRNFAKKRGLHLTNWMITKMHLIKSPPTLFTHVGLSPLQF